MDKTTELLIIALLLAIMAEVFVLTRPKKRHQIGQISTLVDTSVLMDGRVVELAKTGFLQGQVVVPKSVLSELQLLADGSDHDKRERARMGMDAAKELKEILGVSFMLLQDGKMVGHGVDEQLIYLAKQTDSSILTLDYNLNKVAQVEGVAVLNINELAKSLRMVHLPGDTVDIELVQKGQSPDQAVGYLSDGTMVVVEQAKQYINQTKLVEIVRSLQTDAGKMMFAKLVKSDGANRSKRASSEQSNATKPTQQKNTASGTARRQPQKQQSSQPTSRKTDDRSKQSQPSHAKQDQKRTVAATPRRRKTMAQREEDLVKLADGQ